MIKQYFMQRRALFAFYLLSNLCYFVVALVYRASLSPVRYAFIILTFLFLLFLSVDFYRFRQKMKRLSRIKNAVSCTKNDYPSAATPQEEMYQQILSLSYAKFQEQDKRQKSTDREREDYYTLWVHQIKTPLSAMRLALQSGDENAERVLKQELFKVERYADMALQYARMSDMQSDLSFQKCDLEKMVRAEVRKYATLFIYQGLSVNVVDMHGAAVETDEKWFSFLFEQFLSNAVKYTHKGGVTIEWKNNALILSDTGEGIRTEDLPRIFERGFTGFNGRTDKRASGLGLYMAKRVAGSLSIRLSVDSAPEKGTSVTIVFPEKIQM